MWVSATYRPKNTVEHRVVDFVHALSAFLGLLWWFLGCFRDWTCWGILGATIFATTRKNQTANNKRSENTLCSETFQPLNTHRQNQHLNFTTTEQKDQFNIFFFSWVMLFKEYIRVMQKMAASPKIRLSVTQNTKLHKYCENCTWI